MRNKYLKTIIAFQNLAAADIVAFDKLAILEANWSFKKSNAVENFVNRKAVLMGNIPDQQIRFSRTNVCARFNSHIARIYIWNFIDGIMMRR